MNGMVVELKSRRYVLCVRVLIGTLPDTGRVSMSTHDDTGGILVGGWGYNQYNKRFGGQHDKRK